MILDQTVALEAVLAGAIAASQPEFHVWYSDWTDAGEETPPGQYRGALNSTTDVTILAAPSGRSMMRQVTEMSIYNKDSASVTVTIKTDDGTTERIIRKEVIPTLKALTWGENVGWQLQA